MAVHSYKRNRWGNVQQATQTFRKSKKPKKLITLVRQISRRGHMSGEREVETFVTRLAAGDEALERHLNQERGETGASAGTTTRNDFASRIPSGVRRRAGRKSQVRNRSV